MIKQLQRRFIRIAVVTLTVAMVLVVGIVNVANWISVRGELYNTLSLISMTSPGSHLPEEASDGQERTDRENREIFSSLLTGRRVLILILRSVSVVSSFMMGGWIMGTRAM